MTVAEARPVIEEDECERLESSDSVSHTILILKDSFDIPKVHHSACVCRTLSITSVGAIDRGACLKTYPLASCPPTGSPADENNHLSATYDPDCSHNSLIQTTPSVDLFGSLVVKNYEVVVENNEFLCLDASLKLKERHGCRSAARLSPR